MNFALDYQETRGGLLTARGAGLNYAYDANVQKLRITRRDSSKKLTRITFDEALSKDPLTYLRALEKASQIKALIFSNNKTINIAETLDCFKLKPILKSTARLSRNAYDLQSANYERFARKFGKEFGLKCLKLKKFTAKSRDSSFYVARIQTLHDNNISVRACTLAGITAALSDKTARDLIMMEYGQRFENSAHNLLQLSSRLSTLSFILDDHFVPARKIIPEEDALETIPTD